MSDELQHLREMERSSDEFTVRTALRTAIELLESRPYAVEVENGAERPLWDVRETLVTPRQIKARIRYQGGVIEMIAVSSDVILHMG